MKFSPQVRKQIRAKFDGHCALCGHSLERGMQRSIRFVLIQETNNPIVFHFEKVSSTKTAQN